MPIGVPINPGRVCWTGENPGIMLKEQPDGPWSALALLFRVAWSPQGAGIALVLYEQPNRTATLPHCNNVVITDNQPMAQFLMGDFVAKFGVFGEVPAFANMHYLPVTYAKTTGDPIGNRYCEAVASDGLSVELVWEQLGRPTAIEVPPELSGTGQHTMFSLLVESREAAIFVNGRRLAGAPQAREQAGLQTTTAFLYFAESWISG